jgi:4-hydroxy-tetrahydrodipicolinate synthase
MQEEQFKGVFALLLTPFLENNEIDWKAYDRYVDWQLSHHPHGLFAVCGSSEMGSLALQERLDLAARAVKRAGGSLPVLATANVESNHMEHQQELLRMVETGVSGVVLIPPNGMGADQERLAEYFIEMAEISPLPVFLYECPMVKPHLIDAAIYSELANQHGIRGIKDTTCTIEGIMAKITGAPNGIVYQANTPFMLEAIHQGAGGIMAITATAAVQMVLELWELGVRRDPSANAVLEKLVSLDALLGKGFTSTGKYLVSLQDIPMNVHSRNGKEMNQATAKAMEIWHSASLRV